MHGSKKSEKTAQYLSEDAVKYFKLIILTIFGAGLFLLNTGCAVVFTRDTSGEISKFKFPESQPSSIQFRINGVVKDWNQPRYIYIPTSDPIYSAVGSALENTFVKAKISILPTAFDQKYLDGYALTENEWDKLKTNSQKPSADYLLEFNCIKPIDVDLIDTKFLVGFVSFATIGIIPYVYPYKINCEVKMYDKNNRIIMISEIKSNIWEWRSIFLWVRSDAKIFTKHQELLRDKVKESIINLIDR